MLLSSLGANDEGAANAQSPADIDRLIARNADAVYKLAFARCGNRADADDIFQQVMLRYLNRRPDFANAEHERAWFLRVTANCTKSFWGSAFRRHTRALTEDIPAEKVITQTDAADIASYLQQLPKNYRVVIHLFYYEDMPTAEIARLLNRRESTVRMQLTRARRLLKEILKGENDFEF